MATMSYGCEVAHAPMEREYERYSMSANARKMMLKERKVW
jgi:hypothetical protein